LSLDISDFATYAGGYAFVRVSLPGETVNPWSYVGAKTSS
jgi:hypothetical protein